MGEAGIRDDFLGPRKNIQTGRKDCLPFRRKNELKGLEVRGEPSR